MRRLITGLTCVALALGTTALSPGAATASGAAAASRAAASAATTLDAGPVPATAGFIPRPFPGGPAAHSAAWHPIRGISRALLLTVARGEAMAPSDRVVLLQCTVPGGTHPRPSEACRLLEPISGDLGDLKVSRDVACTKQYEPVTVSASGMWDGHRLWFERTFSNPCELHAYTGAVYNF
jgi:hypothetical protein